MGQRPAVSERYGVWGRPGVPLGYEAVHQGISTNLVRTGDDLGKSSVALILALDDGLYDGGVV